MPETQAAAKTASAIAPAITAVRMFLWARRLSMPRRSLQQAGARTGPHLERSFGRRDPLREEGEHVAAEAAADHAGADRAGRPGALHRRLDLGHGGGEVVAQAPVGGVEEPAGGGEVRGAQRG